jgi:hypothetical protein
MEEESEDMLLMFLFLVLSYLKIYKVDTGKMNVPKEQPPLNAALSHGGPTKKKEVKSERGEEKVWAA